MRHLVRRAVFGLTLLGVTGSLLLRAQGTFVNGNFETGDFTGWTQGGGYWGGEWPIDPSSYLQGGRSYQPSYARFSVNGPGPLQDLNTDNRLDKIYSGEKTAQINDADSDNSISVISQTVTNYTDPHIYFAWAAVLQSSHGPRDSDNFILQLKDVTTGETLYQVAYNSADAATAPLFTRSSTDWYYTAWQVQDLDVSARAGHTFTLTLLASDCPYGGHAGYVYLDGFGATAPPPGPEETSGLRTTGNIDMGVFDVGSRIEASVGASGGTGTYKWSSGALPPGFTFSDGNLSGTATVPGRYSVTVIVQDSAGSSSAATITFAVFGFTLQALPDAVQFSPYVASLGLAAATIPFSFTTSGLPPGLSATSSGTIQGTTSQVGSYSVSLTGTDADGRSISGVLTLRVIAPPPMSVTSTSLPGGVVGNVYSRNLAGIGGAPPYTWTLISGTLPDGLVLRPGGTVAGIPTRAGTFDLGLRMTDVRGALAGGQVRLIISPRQLTITTPSPLATGMTGVEYPEQLFSASGGTPPYKFSVSSGSLPSGITLAENGALTGIAGAAGNYLFTVTVTDSTGATGSATPGLRIRPFANDIILSAGSLAMELTAGAESLPSAQTVGVQITRPGFPLAYGVTILPATVNWLKVEDTGVAPGRLTVSLTPAALELPAAGTPYTASVQVRCTDASQCAGEVQELLVGLRVSIVPPQFAVLTDLVSFSASPGPGGVSQELGIQNIGGGAVGIGAVSCGAPWCTVTGIPSFLPSGPPQQLSVNVDPAGLGAGYYRTTVTARTSTGTASVPLTLFVSNEGLIGLQPSGAQFLSQAGGVPVGGTNSFYVTAAGSSSIAWSASVLPGANWLVVDTPSGSANPTEPGIVKFSIVPGVAQGLAQGAYYGQIRVDAPGAANSPLNFVVVLSVAPAGSIQRPSPTPSGLLFIAPPGTVVPPQTVSVATNSAQPVTYTAAAEIASPWLKVSPATGTATPGNPALSNIAVDTSKLAPGVYFGGVTYEFAGPVRTVNVTLIVPSAGQEVTNLTKLAPRAVCAPGKLVAAQTGLPGNFAAPAAWPTPLTMRLYNDCGDPIANGQVVVTFSNGDPPLALKLAEGKTGTYAGTWTPRRTSSQISLKARSSAAGFAAVTTEVVGAVSPNEAPLLDSNAALHIFNPQKGAALAPGTLITLTGTALAGVPATAPEGNLPTTLSGTKVIIGGIEAPVASVTPTVLTVQTPIALETAKQYQVIVSANGALTTPDNFQLAPVSPGIQSNGAGYATALVKGTVVTSATPPIPGDQVTVYAAGLGATDPAVPAGEVTPSGNPVRITSPVSLSLGGKPVVVTFAGLQPGTVGVYQIDFTVPDTAAEGDLPLDLVQDGQTSNSVLLPVGKKP